MSLGDTWKNEMKSVYCKVYGSNKAVGIEVWMAKRWKWQKGENGKSWTKKRGEKSGRNNATIMPATTRLYT